ncbi:hypothetical protein vseg_018099 [Gypsophila vaccaria]
MSSNHIFMFGLMLIALFVTSEVVAARELAATSHAEFTTYGHTEAKEVDDPRNAESIDNYPMGYPTAYGGGYPPAG